MKPGERRGHRSPQAVVGWCAARKVCAEALIAEETVANSQYSLCLTYNDNTLDTGPSPACWHSYAKPPETKTSRIGSEVAGCPFERR